MFSPKPPGRPAGRATDLTFLHLDSSSSFTTVYKSIRCESPGPRVSPNRIKIHTVLDVLGKSLPRACQGLASWQALTRNVKMQHENHTLSEPHPGPALTFIFSIQAGIQSILPVCTKPTSGRVRSNHVLTRFVNIVRGFCTRLKT